MSSKINQTVLMSDARYFDDGQQINPFMTHLDAVDINRAETEHQQIKKAFERAGIKVIQVASPTSCQDGVYTANWALIRGDVAVLSSLPSARKQEEAYALQTLKDLGFKTVNLPDGLKFSGQGDALPCGDFLFCGSVYRSDVLAQEFVADKLGYKQIQLQTVPLTDKNNQPIINKFSGWPDSFYYDLDLALSIIKPPTKTKKALIAWCPEAFTPKSQQIMQDFNKVDKIEVSGLEAKRFMACNLVSTGEVVIMNNGAVNFSASLKQHGLTVVELDNPELKKGGGSIRCTSLTLE